MKEIRIKKSNFKIIFLAFFGLVFAFLCLDMFLNAEEYVSFVFRYEIFIKVFGIIGFVFTTLIIVLIALKYFKNSYGLTINDKGIIDNSSVVSLGLIEWKDIIGIREKNISTTQILLIDVQDSDKYLKKGKNIFISMLLKVNLKTYGTPILISDKSLKCTFEELNNIVKEQYRIYGNVGNVSN